MAAQLIDKARSIGLSNRDLLIILGDVGINYYGSIRDQIHKEILTSIPATILCIRGNHEMRPTDPKLNGIYQEIEWNDDYAYVETKYPRLIMAKDGARYKINGQSYLIIGGAYSVDKYYRLAMHWNWFPDEQLSLEEMNEIREKILCHGNQEDIILAHTCPYNQRPVDKFISGVDQSKVDNTMEYFLQEIIEQTEYNMLYCGHWHIDREGKKIHFLFQDIIRIV